MPHFNKCTHSPSIIICVQQIQIYIYSHTEIDRSRTNTARKNGKFYDRESHNLYNFNLFISFAFSFFYVQKIIICIIIAVYFVFLFCSIAYTNRCGVHVLGILYISLTFLIFFFDTLVLGLFLMVYSFASTTVYFEWMKHAKKRSKKKKTQQTSKQETKYMVSLRILCVNFVIILYFHISICVTIRVYMYILHSNINAAYINLKFEK